MQSGQSLFIMDANQQKISSKLEREIKFLKCIIKSGRLEFEWSIITPSTYDWIALYEDNDKANKEGVQSHIRIF